MPFKRKRPHYKGRDNVVRGVFPEQPRHDQVTFAQARREYGVRVLVVKAELTQLRYKQHLDEYEQYLKSIGLDPANVLAESVLTWDHLDNFLYYLEEELPKVRTTRGRPRREGGLAPSTRNTYAAPVLALGSFASRRYKFPYRLAGYDLAKIDRGEPRSLTLAETRKGFRVAKKRRYGLRDHALFVLAILTGFRTSEIAKLCLRDLTAKYIIVGRRKKRGMPVRREPFPLKRTLAVVLREYLQVAYPGLPWDEIGDEIEGPRLEGTYKGVLIADLPLFPSSRGSGLTALKQKEIIAIIEGIIEEATDRHEGAHATRHTFIALLAATNIPLAYLRDLAGHEHLASLRPYLRFRVVEVAEAYDKHFPIELFDDEMIEAIGIAEGEKGDEAHGS